MSWLAEPRRGTEEEVRDLRVGSDFREPRYRREVFLRFYEFHTRYASHPGCVYYLMPELAKRHGWGMEEKLWYAYINGNTQNPVTSLLVFRRFPRLGDAAGETLGDWWRENSARLPFDTDRRYHRKVFPEAARRYLLLTGGRQEEYFRDLIGAGDEHAAFRALWARVTSKFPYFGRLSSFSYLEYLRIMGLPLDCDNLFLEDLSGSKSHRNGLAKVLGRDDLDWHKGNPSGFNGEYGQEMMGWLRSEAGALLAEAQQRFAGASYFTMESALCTYKSWHRPNRRYPNVYNDLLHDRIRRVQELWPDEDLAVFWEARREALPRHLRLEDNPADAGAKPEKQNHYLTTGEVIMMDKDWPCFRNSYNDRVDAAQGDTP